MKPLTGTDLWIWRNIDIAWAEKRRARTSDAGRTIALNFFRNAFEQQANLPGRSKPSVLLFTYMYKEMVLALRGPFDGLTRGERLDALVLLERCASRASKRDPMDSLRIQDRSWSGLPKEDWFCVAEHALSTLPYDADRHHLLVDVATSTLSQVHKEFILKSTYPDDWFSHAVKENIEPLLPTDELSRLNMLPWFGAVSACENNMRMTQLYCPNIGQVLSGLVNTADWADRAKIMAYASSLGSPPQETAALPSDLLASLEPT